MTEEVNQEVELYDEVTDEIVDETLEEANAPVAKGKPDANATDEEDSIASVDKAADATKAKQAPAPKTKAGMINAMSMKLNAMKKQDLQAAYGKVMGEDVEVEEDEWISETRMQIYDRQPAGLKKFTVTNKKTGKVMSGIKAKTAGKAIASVAKFQSNDRQQFDRSDFSVKQESYEFDTSAQLEALVESEATLSEEFKAKTAILFETAVKSKLSEEIDRLETQYEEELAEEIASTKSDLVEKVDSYLNYVVETWMEENKLAIQSGLRTEIAETFMEKMKDLFTESYIDVPESKVDLVDELAEQVEELESKLNETTQKVIDTTEELEVYKREMIIRESARDLAETQVEKLKSLVADIDFDSEEQFASKVATVKESYFKKQVTGDEEIESVSDDTDQTVNVSSVMESYLQTIRKTAPKA